MAKNDIIGLVNSSRLDLITSILCTQCALRDLLKLVGSATECGLCVHYGYLWPLHKDQIVKFPQGLVCPQCGRTVIKRKKE